MKKENITIALIFIVLIVGAILVFIYQKELKHEPFIEESIMWEISK